MEKSVDMGKIFIALLTDLSKVFDCLPHGLITVKLNVYGFSFSAARLIQSYLSYRKPRPKINNAYISWEELLFGVPQSCILERLLFNFFICDLFSIIRNLNFVSYTGDYYYYYYYYY